MTVNDVTSAPSMLASVRLSAGACSTSVGVLPSFPMMPCACTHTSSLQMVVISQSACFQTLIMRLFCFW